MSRSGSSIVKEVKVKEGPVESEAEARISVEVTSDECMDGGSSQCEIQSVSMASEVGSVPDECEKMQLEEIETSKRGRQESGDNDASNQRDSNSPKAEEMYDAEKENDFDTEAETSCFKIDKVYSMTDEQDDLEICDNDKGAKDEKGEATNGALDIKTEAVSAAKPDVQEMKVKDEKPIKPKATRSALTKMPSLAGVGGVRVLGGGVRGPNMPLIVSMGAGNPAIPLLPAGLPPGRYVILPGTCTSTKTSTCATVTTTSTSLNPRLSTSIAPSVSQSLATVAATATVTAHRNMTGSPHAPITVPPASGCSKMYTRERGRRKSYTAGEKLAMIEAVEAGQRKSAVADRFGVAPSTLACILAQKHKIRAEQDNLTRRRVRHGKYQLREEARAKVPAIAPAMQLSTSAEHPFTHFLAPLTAPTPTVFDTQPEEIIAVPDLMERLTGTGSGVSSCKAEGNSDGDDEGASGMDGGAAQESECLQEPQDQKTKGFQQSLATEQEDGGDDASRQDASEQPSSPSQGSQELVGPYLLKKESHCTTVLDQLLRDDTYTDVTLTAEGQSLRAHRIVLCLASPYFRQVLSREMNVQSVVLLRDVKFAELRNIINFIYTGEATVDATELESFMRTAEMLEISSLCEGQKCIASRGSQAQGGGSSSSGFTIADFEKLVGAKRTRRESSSPTPCKSIRLSGEDQSSRCSSAEPSANPLALIKEEPLDNAPTPTGEPADGETKPRDAEPDGVSGADGGGGRERRESSGSIGGFASIAGLQKEASGGEGGAPEIFIATAEATLQAEEAEGAAAGGGPGRCPYCPHLTQKFEGVPMMRHLLVSHPCKPAFPCDSCWRVFVKRASFKSHQQKCQAQSF
ncbi:uncharacterized protein LOC134780567 [Penaeus indicus]|uniref:uncharacterized protein LOC134780567 n=1 Tax=Penaeus indicus TaxID=29960 RepID=UPI00300CB9AF